jgi:hypothetical protein
MRQKNLKKDFALEKTKQPGLMYIYALTQTSCGVSERERETTTAFPRKKVCCCFLKVHNIT